jgi:hypothetical protein
MVGIPAAIGQAAGLAASIASKLGIAPKTWRDRLKPAAYTSPLTKTRVTFDFEDLSRSFPIRGTQFDFPGVNNSYIQQSGYGSRKYPFACFFSGPQCDLLATQFEKILLEPGTGRLEHPIYGTVDVVPLGDVDRSDALKSACNQSVVAVTWLTTTGAIYPSSQNNAQNEIAGFLNGFNLALGNGMPKLSKLSDTLSAIATIQKFLKNVKKSLSKIKGAIASVSQGVTDVRSVIAGGFDAINEGMDVLIGAPLQLALQISNLIQAPGRALTGIESRLNAYADLANSIFGSSEANPGPALSAGSILLARQTKVANDFNLSNLFALNAVAGSVVSATTQPIGGPNSPFTSRAQVVSAAAAVLGQLDAVTAWRDAGFTALGAVDMPADLQIDTGEAYAALQQLVAIAAGYLIRASFSLLPEKTITLSRPRTIIDLSAEIYGRVDDDTLNRLINTNNLSGDELLELPQNRRIVYYPSA